MREMKRLSSAPVHVSPENEDTPLQLIVSDAAAVWTPQYLKKDAGHFPSCHGALSVSVCSLGMVFALYFCTMPSVHFSLNFGEKYPKVKFAPSQFRSRKGSS